MLVSGRVDICFFQSLQPGDLHPEDLPKMAWAKLTLFGVFFPGFGPGVTKTDSQIRREMDGNP